MTPKTKAAIALIPEALKELTIQEYTVFTGGLLIKDRIQQHFKHVAKLEGQLRKDKAARGYCSGQITCMAMTKGKMCPKCVRARKNPRFQYRHSEYGKMRLKERAEERKERERLKGKK